MITINRLFMQLVCRKACVAFALAFGLSIVFQATALAGDGLVTESDAEQGRAILLQRMSYIGAKADVGIEGDRLSVVFHSQLPRRVEEIITGPGSVRIWIVPRGPTYQPPSRRAIAHAQLANENGYRVLRLTMQDPRAFLDFTKKNMNRTVRFEVDGFAVSESTIVAPIGADAEVIRAKTGAPAVLYDRAIAAVINSGSLSPSLVVRVIKPTKRAAIEKS